jgi:hypothetical protein
MWTRWTKLTLPVAAVVLLSGCGGPGDLTGTVRYRDQPLPYGTVQARGADGLVREAPVGPDGTYTISGLPLGPAALSVTCRAPREVDRTPARAAGGRSASDARLSQPAGRTVDRTAETSLIPAVYSDLDRSGLSFTLQPGANRCEIDLK